MLDSLYLICKSRSLVDLDELVNERMKQGYTPQGGVSFGKDEYGSSTYVQAMLFDFSSPYLRIHTEKGSTTFFVREDKNVRTVPSTNAERTLLQ